MEQGIINVTYVSLYTAPELSNHCPYRWPITPKDARPSAGAVLYIDPNSLFWQHNWKWPTRYPVAHEHVCNRHNKCTSYYSYYIVNSNLVNFRSPMAFYHLSNRFQILNKAWQYDCRAPGKISKWFDKHTCNDYGTGVVLKQQYTRNILYLSLFNVSVKTNQYCISQVLRLNSLRLMNEWSYYQHNGNYYHQGDNY